MRWPAVDQAELWQTADRVRSTDVALKAEAEALGAAPEDAPVIEEIERRHAEFEKAQERHEDVRHHAIFIGGACALAAIPAALLNRFYALPFLAVAMLTTVISIRFRRRMELARKAETEALAAAGARVVHRVPPAAGERPAAGPAQPPAPRRRRPRTTGSAVERWQALAGEVAVEWALTMRERIATLAERLADEGRARRGARAARACRRGGAGRSAPTRWSPGWPSCATRARAARASRSSSTSR